MTMENRLRLVGLGAALMLLTQAAQMVAMATGHPVDLSPLLVVLRPLAILVSFADPIRWGVLVGLIVITPLALLADRTSCAAPAPLNVQPGSVPPA
ncbi:MAG TPA: hypothetical protein VG015_03845 [Candidatus Dormibacteraeota bacterium]|jgi:hypothetical protein|nr:hypothetical protein [Candidatus Dormibacteraeota bacterium]